ncbi:MAG TPA: hypothetical protein VGF63_11630, partial [Solirubrobacteraceae bacterium]
MLTLGLHVRRAEALELRQVTVRGGVVQRRRRGERLLVDVVAQARDVEVALGDPVARELRVDHLAERVDADLVDEHL